MEGKRRGLREGKGEVVKGRERGGKGEGGGVSEAMEGGRTAKRVERRDWKAGNGRPILHHQGHLAHPH